MTSIKKLTSTPKKTLQKRLQKAPSFPKNFEPEEVLVLLKQVVLSCLAEENYTIALKAIELWGKELGLFSQKKNDPKGKKLSDFSTKELEDFLEETEGS